MNTLRKYTGFSNAYRYGFNGYENDNEVKNITGGHISFDDYGYDPRIVTRWNIDPKTSSYPWQSPYVYAAGNPILNIDVDGEGDVYYLLVIDSKSGKAAFQTLEFKDNSPDKNHFVIHFKNKDGSIGKVNVSEKTFNKTRFNLIANTTLIKTKTFTREGTNPKLGNEPLGDGHIEYIPDDGSNRNDKGGAFSWFRDLAKAMGFGQETVMEGVDKTPIETPENFKTQKSDNIEKTDPEYNVIIKRSNGDLDTLPVFIDTTTTKKSVEESTSKFVKIIEKKK